MAVMRIARTLALLTAVLSGYVALRHKRTVRRRLELGVKPEPLQRWEGEGGSVSAAKRPSKKKPARSAVPADMEDTTEAL